MSVAIELKPHVGIHLVLGHEIEHAQDFVYADGRYIGIVTRGKRPVFSLLRHASQAEIIAAFDHIRKDRGEPEFVGVPPNIPTELLKAQHDDEDDDE